LESNSGNHLSFVSPWHEGIYQTRTEDSYQGVRKGSRLVKWQIVFTKQAQKDATKLSSAGLKPKAEELLELLTRNPYTNPPPYEKLVGDLNDAFSRRINIHNRLVYQVLEKDKIVKVIRMWTHYE
jgi:toxin YoeB